MIRKTIANKIELQGIGVFSNQISKVILSPATCNSGIRIIRNDLKENNVIYVNTKSTFTTYKMSTTISNGFCEISLIEHLLATIWYFEITDVDIYVNCDEIPMLDGSSRIWLNLINNAGIKTFDEEKQYKYIDKEYKITFEDKFIIAKPSDRLIINYTIDFNEKTIGKKTFIFDEKQHNFAKEIALARTFCTEKQAEEHKKIKKHFSNNEIIIFNDSGYSVSNNALRYDNEPVRHKILDIIGDFMSTGEYICAEIIAHKSGHIMNRELINKIFQ